MNTLRNIIQMVALLGLACLVVTPLVFAETKSDEAENETRCDIIVSVIGDVTQKDFSVLVKYTNRSETETLKLNMPDPTDKDQVPLYRGFVLLVNGEPLTPNNTSDAWTTIRFKHNATIPPGKTYEVNVKIYTLCQMNGNLYPCVVMTMEHLRVYVIR